MNTSTKTAGHSDSAKWEEIYQRGEQINTAPFDEVVAFVAKYAPDKPRGDTFIMEVGCGCGNNTNWLANEGYKVVGLDSVQMAINRANGRGKHHRASHHCTDITKSLKHHSAASFDMVIDRACLSFLDTPTMEGVIADIHRILRPGGHLLLTPYSKPGPGNPYYYDAYELREIISDNWKIEQIHESSVHDQLNDRRIESHWRIVLRKI